MRRLQIGFALHHQYDGGERGLELWHEWSLLGNNYDAAEIDEKWASLEIAGKGRQPYRPHHSADGEGARRGRSGLRPSPRSRTSSPLQPTWTACGRSATRSSTSNSIT